MNKTNRDQLEYQIRYANEVLGNLEQFSENFQEEKDDIRRLLGWVKESLEEVEPFLESDYDILRVAKIRIRIMKLVNDL